MRRNSLGYLVPERDPVDHGRIRNLKNIADQERALYENQKSHISLHSGVVGGKLPRTATWCQKNAFELAGRTPIFCLSWIIDPKILYIFSLILGLILITLGCLKLSPFLSKSIYKNLSKQYKIYSKNNQFLPKSYVKYLRHYTAYLEISCGLSFCVFGEQTNVSKIIKTGMNIILLIILCLNIILQQFSSQDPKMPATPFKPVLLATILIAKLSISICAYTDWLSKTSKTETGSRRHRKQSLDDKFVRCGDSTLLTNRSYISKIPSARASDNKNKKGKNFVFKRNLSLK